MQKKNQAFRLESYLDLLPSDLLEHLIELHSDFGVLMPAISNRMNTVHNRKGFAERLALDYIGPNYKSSYFNRHLGIGISSHPTFYYHNFKTNFAEVIDAVNANKPMKFNQALILIKKASSLRSETIIPKIFNLLLLNSPADIADQRTTVYYKKNFRKLVKLFITPKMNNVLIAILNMLKMKLTGEQQEKLFNHLDTKILGECILNDNVAMVNILKKEFKISPKEIKNDTLTKFKFLIVSNLYLDANTESISNLGAMDKDESVETTNRFFLIRAIRTIIAVHLGAFVIASLFWLSNQISSEIFFKIALPILVLSLTCFTLGIIGLRRLGYCVVTDNSVTPPENLTSGLFSWFKPRNPVIVSEEDPLLRMETGRPQYN